MPVTKRSPYLFTSTASFPGGIVASTLTGNQTISGSQSVTGTLTVSGSVSVASERAGGAANYANFSTTGRLTFAGTGRFKRDLVIPWTAFAAGSANTSGSSDAQSAASLIDAGTLSGSIPCLAFMNTLSACMVNATHPFPSDYATTGSVQLLADWAFAKTLASIAYIGACVYYVTGSNNVAAAGAFAGSGLTVASATSSTACTMTTTQLGTLNSFSASAGVIVAKFWRDATNASDISGSEFRFLGLRLRYVSDNYGPASTE